MEALDFFIKRAERINITCYHDAIFITFFMELDPWGRANRAIGIGWDEKGSFDLSCYQDWGGDGHCADSINADEWNALTGFVPLLMAGRDEISQIKSLLVRSENEYCRMQISASSIEFNLARHIWHEENRNDRRSWRMIRGLEQSFEGEVPDLLIEEMPRIAQLIWGDNLKPADRNG